MGRGRGIGLVALLLLAIPVDGAAQGWVEPPGVDRAGFVVDKVRSEVRVRLDGRVARVEVSEWFRNTGARVAEGHYLYPLPGEAVFEGFSLFQGDAELRGEIMDADQARAVYEEIVRRRADPALIELAGQGLLRARLFPIEPGQDRKVTLRFTQVLTRAGDALQFLYAGAVKGTSEARPMRGAQGVPGGVPASDVARPGASAGDVPGVFEVLVERGDAYLDPFSPTHDVEVTRSDGRLRVRVEGEVQGRLSLFLPLAADAVGISLATHRPPNEDGYFMLTLTPGNHRGPSEPRDVTVVMDVSGSMSGGKIEQARAALKGLLETLTPDDRFRLVAFSNAVRVLAATWSHPSGADLAAARTWVDGLIADGGTNIGDALDEAFRLSSPEDRLPIVIFLTDGLPSVGEQSPERLADRAERRAGRARVFAFGVGHDVNTHLLDRLGDAGRGGTQYVEPGENVERAMGLLSMKIRHPVLTDLEIAGAPVRVDEIYPVHIPDVFAGEELVLFGRYHGAAEGRLRLRGVRSGVAEEFSVDAAFPRASDANAYIPRLWASRKLGHLTRQTWTEGETAGLVEEIRTVALRYGLPSPYTSYLVQEPEVVADQQGPPTGTSLRTAPVPAPRSSTIPAAASGAGAVQVAQEARRMRDAKSVADLFDAEEKLAESVGAAGRADLRSVGGRVFRLDGGVWKDVAHRDQAAVLKVKVYSAAYFSLLRGLPELGPVLARMSPVVVAGAAVSVQVGDEGVDEMDEAALAGLVSRFRGEHPAP